MTNRKQYQRAEHELKTRAEAQAFARTSGSGPYYRIERRYAPQSPDRNDDGYICVVRVQAKPFGPINDQREYP